MAVSIRRVEYFYATVKDSPGEAFRLLARLASSEVNLLAFSGCPMGPVHTQLVLLPENVDLLIRAAQDLSWDLTGPYEAFMCQADDELGALADIHKKL